MTQRFGRFATLARFAALFALAGLSACGGNSQFSGSMTAQLQRCRAESAIVYRASSFDDYLSRVRAAGRRCGIGSSALAALSGVERRAELDGEPRLPYGLAPQLAALPRNEFRGTGINPTRKYVEDRLDRLGDTGRELLRRHGSVLKRVEARYGVPAEYIVAFWGVETHFGRFTGNHDVVATLANLGYGSGRQRFFTEELFGALILLDRRLVPRGFRGSYAGAFGQAQFMPTSYIHNAVDFDGDGRADLFGSLPDVFASIANYEVQRGRWDSRVGPAVFEVRLPRDFPFEEADIDKKRDVGFWAGRGVTLANGAQLASNVGESAIILPAGCNGPAFMVTRNFYAVLDYNPLVEYAMAVSMLAETMKAGEYRLYRSWPEEDVLSPGDRARLQSLLNGRGHGDLKVDGKLGQQSRDAIRRAQASLGMCADGYGTASLLYALERGGTRFARDEDRRYRR
ncbi:MAG: lytic murein transglycosylase [Rhodospirillaceae bacterium]|nr:lytic murein transglycosylase [Rhodospirillaceae bacterium]